MFGLDGKVALITGAKRGIGKATALMLAKYGVIVALNGSKDSDELNSAAKEIQGLNSGATAMVVPADITVRSEVEHMVRQIIQEYGHIDILVNNAGIALSNTMMDISEADWQKVIDVNLTGIFHTCQVISPHMMKQKAGRIINISSIAGRRGSIFGDVHYSSAKAGVIGFTKCLAKIMAPYNVNVNAVAPGIVDTMMLSKEHSEASMPNVPLGRVGKPDEIASVILFYASNLSTYVTGTVLDVNGGSYM